MEYAQEQIDSLAESINTTDHFSLCYAWRKSKDGDPKFRNDLITSSGKSLGDIFKERLFDHYGGFTPEISKEIGW